jgi:cyclin B
MATRTSRAVFGDITNAGDSVAALAGKKPLKSERKADDVDARDASNPQAVTEYVNDMRAAASALYRLFFAAAARAVLPRRPSAFVDGVASTAWAVAPQTADAPGVEMGLDARVPLGVAATRTVPHSRRHAHRYVHFREKELETSVSPTYMRQQAHINEKMRAILIDWLVEVHLKFKLVPETLYLTVNLIDRYLLGSPVERSNLQLVGVSALLLASKYEEIYPPELKDLVYITDKAYTQEQILGMEEKMVKALKYKMTIASVRAPRPQRFFFGWRRRGREMTTPSTRPEYRRPDGVSTARAHPLRRAQVHCFMMRYLKAGHADRRMVWLASYVAERMLQEYSMLKYLPSMVAACAVYVARKNLGRNAWSPTLLHYAQYAESDLHACLKDMHGVLHSTKGSLAAVKKKYSSEKYGTVATMPLKVLD